MNATPEEAVRQDVLDWLIDELSFPEGRLRSEFNQRRRGGKGRSDIVVLAPDADDSDGTALMVIECKRPGTFLEDRTREQAIEYAEQLGAKVIVVTNGGKPEVHARSKGKWRELDHMPAWDELLGGRHRGWVAEEKFVRWRWEEIRSGESARAVAEEQEFDWLVGADSPNDLAPFALNLFGLLADEHDGPDVPFTSGDVVIEQDLGQRSRGFSNSGGGSWDSHYYRSFLVFEDGRESHQVVSLTVMGNTKVENHPRWGNRRGSTVLVAAVDDGPKSNAGLNMKLDDATDLASTSTLVDVVHNGSMTTGERGAMKRAAVLQGLAEHGSGDLVRGNRVVLGSLPLEGALTWSNSQQFVGNVIRYALVRDRIRASFKRRSLA